MLKNISPIISPELLKILMEMGHSDEIVIGDGNFPAASIAQRLVRLDGHGVPEVLDAVLKLMPLDTYVDAPVALMDNNGDGDRPAVWDKYEEIVKANEGDKNFELMERFAFYDRARKAYAVIATGIRKHHPQKGRCKITRRTLHQWKKEFWRSTSARRADAR